jgi:hypothetical protein
MLLSSCVSLLIIRLFFFPSNSSRNSSFKKGQKHWFLNFTCYLNLSLKRRCSCSVVVTDGYVNIIHVFPFSSPFFRNVEIPHYLHLISRHITNKYGGVAPRFHDLGTRSWWIVSSTSRPRYLLDDSPWCIGASRLERTQCEAKKFLCFCRVNTDNQPPYFISAFSYIRKCFVESHAFGSTKMWERKEIFYYCCTSKIIQSVL